MNIRILVILTLLLEVTGCRNEQKNYTCLDDAAHDRIGVLMGSAEDGFITQKYPDADILRIDMSTDLLAALMAGSCDVAILSSVEVREILKVNPKLKILQDNVYASPLGVGFHKGNTALRDQFNAFLAQLKSEGVYAQIEARWTDGKGNAVMPPIELPATGEPLTVGTTAVSVPFSYEKNGVLSGFDIEIITRFAASLNRPIRFRSMNFGSLIPALVAKKVDVIINCIMITPERAREIAFSDAYYQSKAAAVVLNNP